MSVNYNPKIVTNGLVLYLDAANIKSYPGSGTVWNDLSGNGNHGTLVNSPTFDNKSIVFNGTKNGSYPYISLGNNKCQYQDNFTVETICKFPNLPNNAGNPCLARHPIVNNNSWGYNLAVIETGLIRFNIYNTVGTGNNVYSLASVIGNNYFHTISIKSGVNLYLYLNGIYQSTAQLSTNVVYYHASYPTFLIGGYGVCGADTFYATGNIAIVKVYNRVLSVAEIQQNFNAIRSRYGV